MFEATKNLCDSFLDLGVPGFDLAVYQNGNCILRHRNGYSDIENKIAMNGKERYNIYSCSKPITCTAAMQLWEKGLFSLDDKLSDYMPEFEKMTVKTEDGIKEAEHPILIRHLFEMTAGFSYDLTSPHLLRCKEETNGRCPTGETMKYLAKEPLLFEPGDRWEYSLCHDVLAALVEVIAKQPFEEYVKEHIFDPLGMDDSTFLLSDDKLDSIAQQYKFRDGKAVNIGKNISHKLGSQYASGGAGCISTVDDYIKFLEALRIGDRILKKETVAWMATDQLTDYQKRTYHRRETYGYGLGMRCPKKNGPYLDFGWGGAAGAYLAIDIEHGLSLYYGTHLISNPAQGPRSLLYRFIMAELFAPHEIDALQQELKSLYNYQLTY